MSAKVKLVETLVDDAMRIFMFDDEWDNENKPEIKALRSNLREAFKKTLKVTIK